MSDGAFVTLDESDAEDLSLALWVYLAPAAAAASTMLTLLSNKATGCQVPSPFSLYSLASLSPVVFIFLFFSLLTSILSFHYHYRACFIDQSFNLKNIFSFLNVDPDPLSFFRGCLT